MSELNPTGSTFTNDGITQSNFSEHLSQLLEQYLALLDQYQFLQTKLTKSLSSGYISLAEASFQSSGIIRYGQDFYDERMQATKLLYGRINSAPGEEGLIPSFEFAQPSPDTPTSKTNASQVADSVSSSTTAKRVSRDPLHWFGILVPPALRASQREFKDAVDVIPKLVEVIAQMDLYEIRIEEARKDGKPREC